MDNVIYLADEYGNEVPYEVVDQISIASEEFAALIHRNDDGTEDVYFVAVKYSGDDVYIEDIPDDITFFLVERSFKKRLSRLFEFE